MHISVLTQLRYKTITYLYSNILLEVITKQDKVTLNAIKTWYNEKSGCCFITNPNGDFLYNRMAGSLPIQNHSSSLITSVVTLGLTAPVVRMVDITP